MDHTNCHVDLLEKLFDGEIPDGLSQTQLLVTGMGCPNCAARVHNALIQMDGVLKADVRLESGMTRVLYDSERVKSAGLLLAIEMMGKQTHHNYQAQVIA